jgi:hypothetical protein
VPDNAPKRDGKTGRFAGTENLTFGLANEPVTANPLPVAPMPNDLLTSSKTTMTATYPWNPRISPYKNYLKKPSPLKMIKPFPPSMPTLKPKIAYWPTSIP